MKTIKRISIILFALIIGLSLAGCKKSKQEQMTDLSVRYASGTNGVVSSASPYASQAGLEVLEKGGNAFDAAVAVAFTLGVVEPFASGVGGGGLMVAYNATTGEYVSYNFREFTPGNGTADNYIEQYKKNFDLEWAKKNNTTVDEIDRTDSTYLTELRTYLDRQSDTDNIFSDGALSVGVPTEVAGLLKVLEEQGSGNVTRQDVLAPAINYADNGFNVTANLASTFLSVIDAIKGVEGCEYFFKDQSFSNAPLEEGELLVQKDYAHTLKLISEQGAAGFYTGEVADAIIEAMEDYGGIITYDDLIYAMNNYPVKITPVTCEYNGYTIASSNVPSSGGTILAETLNLLEYYEATYNNGNDISTLGHNSAEYINILATALQLAYSDKRKYIADTTNDLTIENQIPTLTSKEYAKYRWDSIYNKNILIYTSSTQETLYNYLNKLNQTISPSVSTGFAYNTANNYYIDGKKTSLDYYGDLDDYKRWQLLTETQKEIYRTGSVSVNSLLTTEQINSIQSTSSVLSGVEPEEHYSTTSFSVADKWGNIVSVTQTINHFFGSHIAPTTHDNSGNKIQGYGFFLNNQLGTLSFTGSSVNYAKPYKQPVSHIMPTIITKDGLPYATLGSPGSMRIPSTVVQVILNLIDFNMDIQTAIDSPRFFVYSTGGGDDRTTEFVYNLGDSTYKLSSTGKYIWIECANKALITKLSKMGYFIPVDNRYENIDLYFGGVHGITFDNETGVMTGGADSRRDGKALAF